MEHHGTNGESSYEKAFREWTASLTPAELEQLTRNGCDKPRRDTFNTGTADFSAILSRAHADEPADDLDESSVPITHASEQLALVLLYLAEAPDIRLELYAILFTFGFPCMMGQSQTEIAQRFGLTRAAFSKRCKLVQKKFSIAPARAMKTQAACDNYRLFNGSRMGK